MSELPVNQIVQGDCLEVMRGWPDGCIDAVVTDPPYFEVKSDGWDRQWQDAGAFIGWLGQVLDEFQRLLAANGSLYIFASPQMAGRVEVAVSERFRVLNHLVWVKEAGWHNKASQNDLRGYFPQTERIIFAEPFEAGQDYADKADGIRASVFEPIRAYLASERDRAGFTTRQVAEAYQRKTGSRTVTGMAGHWFERVQWSFPTAENYAWLRELFNQNGGREYEALRAEYEALRRPFELQDWHPKTDVWKFDPVPAYPGKHPCEKPLRLMQAMIEATTRPAALVLDPFAGSGTTLAAAEQIGRRWIGIELSEEYCQIARARTAQRGIFSEVSA